MKPTSTAGTATNAASHLRWRRVAERLTFAMGSVLLAIYGAAAIHSSMGSSAALEYLEAQQVPDDSASSGPGVDFSLWSLKRTRAYLGSLAVVTEEPTAVVIIDRLKVKAPVYRGTSDLVLNRGLGWIQGTARPGDEGNSGIAGHRDGFFRALKDIQVGDEVQVRNSQGRLTYRVNSTSVVSPDDVSVLRHQGTTSLTLVTCFPFYFIGDAPQRFIVHASLETTNFVQKSGSTPSSAASLNQGVVR